MRCSHVSSGNGELVCVYDDYFMCALTPNTHETGTVAGNSVGGFPGTCLCKLVKFALDQFSVLGQLWQLIIELYGRNVQRYKTVILHLWHNLSSCQINLAITIHMPASIPCWLSDPEWFLYCSRVRERHGGMRLRDCWTDGDCDST